MLHVEKIKDFNQLPPNAIIITYSNHYRGNSGDDIFLTDNRGWIYEDEKIPSYWHWNEQYEDRGLISIVAITSNRGGTKLIQEFGRLCNSYVKASKELKFWQNKDNFQGIEIKREEMPLKFVVEFMLANYSTKQTQYYNPNMFVYSKWNDNFEDTEWYKRFKNIARKDTIAKRKKEFLDRNERFNSAISRFLVERKKETAKWFEENNISVRNAYHFNEKIINKIE